MDSGTPPFRMATRTGARRAAVAVVFAGSVFLSGCGAVNMDELAGGVPLSKLAGDAVAGAVSEVVNPQDLAFVSSIAPQVEQTVQLAEIALDKANNPEVLALAEQLVALQAPELALISGVLDLPGVSDVIAGLSQADLQAGLLTDQQLADLQAATGAEFDRLFVEVLIQQRDAVMAAAESALGSASQEIQAVAAAVKAMPWPTSDQLRSLLSQVSG